MAKLAHLEGVRAVAALQVMLMHYLTFFQPSSYCTPYLLCWQEKLRSIGLFFAVDGFAAVGIFFILSGYVLTIAFCGRGLAVTPLLARRWLRLQFPALASLALAAVLFAVFSDSFLSAAQINGSLSWAQGVDPKTYGLFDVLREGFLTTLFFGHHSTSLLTPFGIHVFSDQTLNLPLWSMHAEFWGSMVVIFLIALRDRSPAYSLAVILCLIAFLLHPIALFIVGHLLAVTEQGKREARSGLARNAAALGLIALGLIVMTVRDNLIRADITYDFFTIPWFHAQSPFHFFGYLGACFVFLGIVLSSWVQNLLRTRPLVYLGRLSFSIFLLHAPILLTLGAAAQTALAQIEVLQNAAAPLAFLLSVFLTLVAAHFFARFIDEPSIILSRRLQKILIRRSNNNIK